MKKMKVDKFVNERRYAVTAEKRRQGSGAGMFVKLGVCAAACALVLLVKWIDAPNVENTAVYAQYAASESDGTGSEDGLGKLKFVQLPGILEVFASKDKYPLPLTASAWELQNENTELVLTSAAEQYVSVAAPCEVKACEKDSVILSLEGDREIRCFGNMQVSVEHGQKLRAGDTIAKIASGETLTLNISISGRPADPTEVFYTE